jgi:ferric-dicitrate binding protein FerR (iron transport regulator)
MADRVRAYLAAIVALALLAPHTALARDCAVSAVDGPDARIWDGAARRALDARPLPDAQIRIATGSGTRVEVACDDGVVLTLAADRVVRLDQLLGDGAEDRNVVLELLRGLLGVDAPGPRAGRFDVRTPLAIASVRSTAWLVSHLPDAGTAIFVGRGAVRAITRGAMSTLRRGEGIDVKPDGHAGPVARWGPRRVTAARAALGFGWR